MTDTNWILGWVLAGVIVLGAIGFNMWLSADCYLDYSHGAPQKVCL